MALGVFVFLREEDAFEDVLLFHELVNLLQVGLIAFIIYHTNSL